MKFVKNNPSSWASEESFKVYSGSTLLYTSPEFANSEVRTIEQCLATSTNNQYSIELLDSYGDSWTSGSYLTIFGENENVVFKHFLTASSQETYTCFQEFFDRFITGNLHVLAVLWRRQE